MSSLQSQSTKSSALLVEMDRTHLEDLEKLATMVSDQRNMRHGKRIRSRNKQKKRDPTRIPRPMNCFMAYRLEKQKEIADFCPGANHRDISKIVAKWWKKEPDSVKQKYRVMAEKAKQEHSAMYPHYKYTPKRRRTTTNDSHDSMSQGQAASRSNTLSRNNNSNNDHSDFHRDLSVQASVAAAPQKSLHPWTRHSTTTMAANLIPSPSYEVQSWWFPPFSPAADMTSSFTTVPGSAGSILLSHAPIMASEEADYMHPLSSFTSGSTTDLCATLDSMRPSPSSSTSSLSSSLPSYGCAYQYPFGLTEPDHIKAEQDYSFSSNSDFSGLSDPLVFDPQDNNNFCIDPIQQFSETYGLYMAPFPLSQY